MKRSRTFFKDIQWGQQRRQRLKYRTTSYDWIPISVVLIVATWDITIGPPPIPSQWMTVLIVFLCLVGLLIARRLKDED